MNELTIFNNPEFGYIRSVTIDGEPWFVGRDVAGALGYKDTADALKNHVETEDKLTRRFTESGQGRTMYVINESGLYALIFGSKLESAKRFKRWVTSEVLPTLRKTGAYHMGQPAEESEEIKRLDREIDKLKSATALVKACNADKGLILAVLAAQGVTIPPDTRKGEIEAFENVKDELLSEKSVESLDWFLRAHRICEGDLVRDKYREYVVWCGERRMKPCTRNEFVIRCRQKRNKTSVTVRRGDVSLTIFESVK